MIFLTRYWKAIAALGVVFAFVLYLIYAVEKAKQIVLLEQVVEQQQEYIEDRKGIEDATKGVRGISSDAALEWLRNRSPNEAD